MGGKSNHDSLERILYILPIVLLLPALLINIGLPAFIGDEGIRALVAYEMMLTDNYITPTLHSAFYYKKPPLFNWFILLFFESTGQIREFMPRMVTVIMLLLYSGTVWHFYRKHFDKQLSFMVVFTLITCGRVLFYDSFLGLIDICFSWVIFTLFMVVYHRFIEGRYKRLFIEVYLLAAIAFLLKGLPSIVFVGITLLTIFIWKRQFKKLFSPAHFLSGFLFLLIVGGYYAIYHQYNSLENVFTTLFTESSKRTVVNYGWLETIKHLFTFPFEMAYHFLPWSLLFIFLWPFNYLKKLFANDFLYYNVLVFLTNVIIYWTSPEVYPRYLLMFPPLVFGPLLYLYFQQEKERTVGYQAFHFILGLLIVVTLIGSFAPHFLERLAAIPFVHLKALGITALLIPLTILFFKMKQHRLLIFTAVLLVFRIGFNFFIIPDRLAGDPNGMIRESGLRLGEKYKDENFYVYQDTRMEANTSFYLTKAAGKIISRKYDNYNESDVYIMDLNIYTGLEVVKLDSLAFRENGRNVWLVRFEGLGN